jgi:CRP/FNR family transcriptional regulator, polysaccharide utilization system transcription regulator
LKKSPLNKILSESSGKKILTFHKDDYLFHENEVSNGVYFVITGKVKIVKNHNLPAQTILYLVKPGDVLGIHAVINEHKFTNSAVALVKTSVCFVPAKEFKNWLNCNNKYKLDVMQLLCSSIDILESKIISRTERTAGERFAELLVLLSDTYGLTKDRELKIELSYEDLANLTGTSKAYLSRIISEFCQNNWISFKGNIIKIFSVDKLEKEARLNKIAE